MSPDEAALIWRVSDARTTFLRSDYLCFVDTGSRRRTPGPPPFSAMNTTPGDSRAFWRAATAGRFAINSPRVASNRLIVARETFEASLSALCSSRRMARAARSCSLVSKSATTPRPLKANMTPWGLTNAWGQISPEGSRCHRLEMRAGPKRRGRESPQRYVHWRRKSWSSL